MSNAVRRRSNLVRVKSDRQFVWLGLDLPPTSLAGSTVTLVAALLAAGLALRPFTIVRTRLEVHYRSDQVVATEQTRGALGIIVVSDQAVAQGAASIPAPVTNSDAPFFVYEPFINRFEVLTSAGFHPDAGLHQTEDSKAMRKVGNNEDIAFMITNAASTGAVGTIVGRLLVKLH